MNLPRIALLCALGFLPARALDLNANGLDDVWEQLYGAGALTAGGDADGDGLTNAQESAAGTDPFSANSTFAVVELVAGATEATLGWASQSGKAYCLQGSSNLVDWVAVGAPVMGNDGDLSAQAPLDASLRYLRVCGYDVDSDADGVNDWAELKAGLNPLVPQTTPGVPDAAALTTVLTTPTTLTVEVPAGQVYERNNAGQPTTGLIRIRRTGGLAGFTAAYTLSGRPQPTLDYSQTHSGSAVFGFGQNQVDLPFTAIADTHLEVPETLTLALQPGAGYALGATAQGAVRFDDEENQQETLYFAQVSGVPGAATGASGYATLFLSGDHASVRVSLAFSGLTTPQTAAHIHHMPTHNVVRSLENGQIQDHVWVFPAAGAGGLPSDQHLLDALALHELYVNVHSTTYPSGEIEGRFILTEGSIAFTPPANAPPAPTYTGAALDRDVQRLLVQASFGPTDPLIATVRARGLAGWLDDQMTPALTPQTLLLPFTKAADNWLMAQNAAQPTPNPTYQPFFQSLIHGWWTMAAHAPDQLRQRVALALSEIFVVSMQNSAVRNKQYGTADYWDMLARNAFGNFRTLLEDVTLHPIMGNYLSMIRNEKYNPATGVSPDENYAREVMQLFSIGLVNLHPDGTLKLDGVTGLPSSTYDNTDITELARVFTGWSYSVQQIGGGVTPATWNNNGAVSANNNFNYGGGPGYAQAAYYNPMKMFQDRHDTGAKTIVNDFALPAGQTGEKDLDDAMDALFLHPNTPSFISRRLIQRLVTSNPSRGYVYRVARVFENDGTGVRGNLGAVVRAILLDYEARDQGVAAQAGFGKMREPLLMMTQLFRAQNAASQIPVSVLASQGYTSPYPAGASMLRLTTSMQNLGQTPLNAPSVFNWFKPDFSFPGPVSAAGLYSPEFEIATESQAFNVINLFSSAFWTTTGTAALPGGFFPDTPPGYTATQARVTLSHSGAQGALTAGGVPGLVAYLDGLMAHSSLSAGARAIIEDAVTNTAAIAGSTLDNERIRTAIYLLLHCPDFVIQR